MRNQTTFRPIRKHSFKGPYVLLLGTFFVGLILVDTFPLFSQVIRYVGIGLVGLSLLVFLKYKPIITLEIVIYGVFLFWATLTGALVATHQSAFRDSISTLYQILALMFAVSVFLYLTGNINSIFWIVIISVLILDAYVLFSGSLDFSSQIESTFRASSLLRNPNEFAVYNLLGIFTLLFFTINWKSPSSIIFGTSLGIFFVTCILYSASQKAFLSVILLFCCWYWFCLRKNVNKSKQFPNFILLLIFLSGFVYLTLSNSFLGIRLKESIAGQDASLQSRIILYQQGWNTFLDHPLFGVGVGNTQYYSSIYQVTHSDFLEVLVSTGIIGLIIYVSIYISLWKRTNQIQKLSANSTIIYFSGLIRSFIITFLFIGLGRPLFSSIQIMFILASLIGYSNYLTIKVKREFIADDHMHIPPKTVSKISTSNSQDGIMQTKIRE